MLRSTIAASCGLFLLGSLALSQSFVNQPLKYSFSWKLAPSWLVIEREKVDNVDEWNPSFTHIDVDRAYRPLLILHDDNSYEIVFESNIVQPKR